MNKIIKYISLSILSLFSPFSLVNACISYYTRTEQILMSISGFISIWLFVFGIFFSALYREKKSILYLLAISFYVIIIGIFFSKTSFLTLSPEPFLKILGLGLIFSIPFELILYSNRKKEKVPIYVIVLFAIFIILGWGIINIFTRTACI